MAFTLTAKELRTPENIPHGVHTLERGIYLRVNGARRSWLFKYSINGKRREIALGGIDQPLDAVRAKAYAFKMQVAQGEDPAAARREARDARRAEAQAAKRKSNTPTFGEFYPEAIRHFKYLRQWQTANTEYEWTNHLASAAAALGEKRLDEITTDDVEAVVKKIWGRPKCLHYLLKLSNVFDFAISKGFMTANPAAWRGGLDARLPSLAVLSRGKALPHHRASSAEELKTVMKALEAIGTMSAKALLFGMLTAGRSGEYRNLKWSELDFDKATAMIPPERRKDKRTEPFIVPLSRQAVALLKSLPKTGEYVFSYSGAAPLKHGSLWSQLQNVGGASVHGARSTFSDWCAKNEKNFLVSEKCLMHSVGNQVFRAYQRDDLLEQRRKLLQEWADYLLPNV